MKKHRWSKLNANTSICIDCNCLRGTYSAVNECGKYHGTIYSNNHIDYLRAPVCEPGSDNYVHADGCECAKCLRRV